MKCTSNPHLPQGKTLNTKKTNKTKTKQTKKPKNEKNNNSQSKKPLTSGQYDNEL
jgi:hypothetical protein